MIISASRRTDIPAFFGEWFMKRINEGYFYRVNPFNTKQVSAFRLSPEDVEVIVFWTKNPGPFIKYLDKLEQKGYRYYFTFTLNHYPKEFEPNLPAIGHRMTTFRNLSSRIGKDKVIWRYDPIIVSNLTPIAYHIENINMIAQMLNGYTERLVISFLDFYQKVEKRLKKIREDQHVIFKDITEERFAKELIYLCGEIKKIGDRNGMKVFTCSEKMNLNEVGILHGSCIDGDFIQKAFGLDFHYKKDKNQRRECGCIESIDLGFYNTCRFDCKYCYANQSAAAVDRTLQRHILTNPALIGNFEKGFLQ